MESFYFNFVEGTPEQGTPPPSRDAIVTKCELAADFVKVQLVGPATGERVKLDQVRDLLSVGQHLLMIGIKAFPTLTPQQAGELDYIRNQEPEKFYERQAEFVSEAPHFPGHIFVVTPATQKERGVVLHQAYIHRYRLRAEPMSLISFMFRLASFVSVQTSGETFSRADCLNWAHLTGVPLGEELIGHLKQFDYLTLRGDDTHKRLEITVTAYPLPK